MAKAKRKKRIPYLQVEAIQHFPARPGVYWMRGEQGETLYIGKAKNLKKRVRSYFGNKRRMPRKIAELMRQAVQIEFEELGSELEALLTEATRIKEVQPYFNYQIRYYKRLVYLKVNLAEAFPRLSVSIDLDDDILHPDVVYFGPFMNKALLERHILNLNRIFKLRPCDEGTFRKHRKTPCLAYDFNFCSGPCAERVTHTGYHQQVRGLIAFLSKQSASALELLLQRRDELIESLAFEQAKEAQEQIEVLEKLQSRSYRIIHAARHHHCLLVMPHRVPGAYRLLSVFNGVPDRWFTWTPWEEGYTALSRFVDEVFSRFLLSDTRYSASSLPKAKFEEAKIIASWLNKHPEHQDDSIKVVFLEGLSALDIKGQILDFVRMAPSNRLLDLSPENLPSGEFISSSL